MMTGPAFLAGLEGRCMDPARDTRSLSPKPIMEMATAFQRSRPLLTAFELGLFTVLNSEARTSDETAAALETEPRATDRLMNALVGLGLLDKHEGRFRNTPLAEAYLVRGRPEYIGGLGHTNHMWDTWSRMTDVVRAGHPVGLGDINDRGDAWLRPFIAAMHSRARQTASEVVGVLDLDGVSRVLDVGGGSGAYAMAFVRARRGISAVVFDLPNVIPLTKTYISQEGLSAEVTTSTGDYLTAPLGDLFDVVFMSAVIHSNAPDDNRLLFRKAAHALNPGGQLVVQDFLMNEQRDGPLMAALFALNMLVGTPEGDTYTESEVRSWMTEAGCRTAVRKDTSFGTNLIIGRI
jgi:SAM-dependent methyltransferase